MRKGFTLIELMVVMTVISILATMVLYGLGKAQAAARDVTRYQIMKGYQNALQAYMGDHNTYPVGGLSNGFCGTLDKLILEGYLTSAPLDPSTKQSVCETPCSTGADGCPAGTNVKYIYEYSGYTPPGFTTSPCKTVLTYQTAYQLHLIKESGGDPYFCSPQ